MDHENGEAIFGMRTSLIFKLRLGASISWVVFRSVCPVVSKETCQIQTGLFVPPMLMSGTNKQSFDLGGTNKQSFDLGGTNKQSF
jgi:hypothetical protein